MKKKEKDSIDEYIDAMREPSDGCLTSSEQVKYNIMSNKDAGDIQTSTIMRICAYERFLIRECRWRYPNKKGRILNEKEAKKEYRALCKSMKEIDI